MIHMTKGELFSMEEDVRKWSIKKNKTKADLQIVQFLVDKHKDMIKLRKMSKYTPHGLELLLFARHKEQIHAALQETKRLHKVVRAYYDEIICYIEYAIREIHEKHKPEGNAAKDGER